MRGSVIYRSAWGYELVMRGLYGRHYADRYRVIADLVTPGSTVLELCCGPGFLFERYLGPKGVTYTGLDMNPRFIARVVRLGGRGEVCDLAQAPELPAADTVIMQASLYHFLPDPAPIVDRMRRAARRQVIVAEPVRNLAMSRLPILASLARRLTDPGTGAQPSRFTAESLDALFQKIHIRPALVLSMPGGRERIYVLEPAGLHSPSSPPPPERWTPALAAN